MYITIVVSASLSVISDFQVKGFGVTGLQYISLLLVENIKIPTVFKYTCETVTLKWIFGAF